MSHDWIIRVKSEIDSCTSLPVVIVTLISDYLKGISLIFVPDQLFSGGLFEYLGTRGRTREWQNPTELHVMPQRSLSAAVNAEIGSGSGEGGIPLARMTCHKNGFVHGDVRNCIAVHSGNLALKRGWNEMPNSPGNWFGVELAPGLEFIPTHYTLMNDSQDAYGWYAWDLHASNDGKTWYVLDRKIGHLVVTDPKDRPRLEASAGKGYQHDLLNGSGGPRRQIDEDGEEVSRGDGNGEQREGFAIDRVPQKSLTAAAVKLNGLTVDWTAMGAVSDPPVTATATATTVGGSDSGGSDGAGLASELYQWIDRSDDQKFDKRESSVDAFPDRICGEPPQNARWIGDYRFRYFRVLQHYNNCGKPKENSYGLSDYLKCNGFEMNGTLIDTIGLADSTTIKFIPRPKKKAK